MTRTCINFANFSTYQYLLACLPQGLLVTTYGLLDKKLKEVEGYVTEWLQYQSLWDMDTAFISTRLGSDLFKWQQLLREMKKNRTTFENTESKKDFGQIVIR